MNRLAPLALLLAVATACDEMGPYEAAQALGEANRSGYGEQATNGVVDVSTDFTIGEALADAAQALADFWDSQAPCTTITVTGNTTTVDYGDLNDDCTWQGRTFGGVTAVTVVATGLGELEVDHDWSAFTDGRVTVDGGAIVTWDGLDGTRRVQTEHVWTDTEGHQVDVVGDHLQGLLDEDAGFLGGFTVEGTRDWTSDGDDWSLDMTDLELRLQDPAPQAGSLAVTDPRGRVLSVSYSRVDEDTIEAVLSGVRGGDRVYHIHRLGQVEEVE